MENNSEMRNQICFYQDLEALDFPYKEFVMEDRPVQKGIFQEYLKTEPHPKLSLYTNKYFTKDEIREGLEEAQEKLPDESSNTTASFAEYTDFEKRFNRIRDEFDQRIAKDKLDRQYYGYNLEQTPTIGILRNVQELIGYCENCNDKKLKRYTKRIKQIISNLHPELKNNILKTLSNKKEILWLSELENGGKERAENFRSFFDAIKPQTEQTEQNGQTEQSEQSEQPETPNKEINLYPRIFKDYFAFKLFERLYNEYKDDKPKKVANFSFVFYAMQEDTDKLMIAKPTEFIRFLEKEPYSIFIDRIDNRQSGTNHRMPSYNSIKADQIKIFDALKKTQ